jgi:hypothetical protein
VRGELELPTSWFVEARDQGSKMNGVNCGDPWDLRTVDYRPRPHGERNHQVDNQLIAPARVPHSQSKGIDRRSRLGGMLNFYQRAVA